MAGIDLGAVAGAGLVAGYGMAFIGNWMEGFLELPGFDLGRVGESFVGEGRSDAWWIGLVTHETNSLLFALVYAAVMHGMLPGPLWLRGICFGAILWVAVEGAIWVARAAGARLLFIISLSPRQLASSLVLHLLFGVILAVLYGALVPA